MKAYIVTSWSPWDCNEIHLKCFFSELDAKYFIKNYKRIRKDEDLTIEIADIDLLSLGNMIKDILVFRIEE